MGNVIFLIFTCQKFQRLTNPDLSSFSRACPIAVSIIAVMLGMVTAEIHVLALGSFNLLYGVSGIAGALYQNGKQKNQ